MKTPTARSDNPPHRSFRPGTAWPLAVLLPCLALACGGPGKKRPGLRGPAKAVEARDLPLLAKVKRAVAKAEAEAMARGADPAEISRVQAEAQARILGASPAQAAHAGDMAERAARNEGQQPVPDGEATPPAAAPQTSYLEALTRRDQHLAQEHHFVGRGAAYNLTDTFLHAQQALYRCPPSAATPEGYRINEDYLSCDPYLHGHNPDGNGLIPDDVSEAEWVRMIKVLEATHAVARRHHLTGPLAIASEARPEVKRVVRKRIMRLFLHAEQQTLRGEPPLQEHFAGTETTPLGELAIDLSLQYERCIDGLQDGLVAMEQRAFASSTGRGPAHLGDFISRVLTDYKMAFIERHALLRPKDKEFTTTVATLLRQTMLYALGLRGSFTPVKHAGRFHSTDRCLDSAAVMERFLKGGTAQLSLDNPVPVSFEAYSVDKIIDLLQEARDKAMVDPFGIRPLHPDWVGPRLTFALIKAECVDENYEARDLQLGPVWNDFESIEMLATDNEFFTPALPGEFINNIRLTRAFWLHVLQKYGYICAVNPNPTAHPQEGA